MRLDYNEKKQLGRDKVERRPVQKPVQKNRPRKEPMGLFALLSVLVLAATYGAGVFTGWFFFKGEPVQQAAAVPPAVQPAAPAPPPAAPAEEPLTFYKTLPQGGAVMGSGMNLKLQETAPAAKPAPASAVQGTQPQTAQPQAQGGQSQGGQPQAEKQEKQNKQGQGQDAAAAEEKKEEESRFSVQVASYRDKGEAEAAQAKLAARGIPAYVVESKLADKSVWYRLKAGRNLSKSEAGQMAAKTGKGSVLIPE